MYRDGGRTGRLTYEDVAPFSRVPSPGPDVLQNTILKILLEHPEGVQPGYILKLLYPKKPENPKEILQREALRKRIRRKLVQRPAS